MKRSKNSTWPNSIHSPKTLLNHKIFIWSFFGLHKKLMKRNKKNLFRISKVLWIHFYVGSYSYRKGNFSNKKNWNKKKMEKENFYYIKSCARLWRKRLQNCWTMKWLLLIVFQKIFLHFFLHRNWKPIFTEWKYV